MYLCTWWICKCNTPTLYELQIFILCNCVLRVTFVNSGCKLQMETVN